jgi:chemotaxis protein histidine kinase CheA
MAIKKAIEIDVSTIQAVGGLNNLSVALEKVDASAKGVDATFEQVYGDLKPLTARMGEAEDRLYELAMAGQTATQEYKDLLAAVAQYRKVQMQTDMTVDAASGKLSDKLGGSLQGVSSAFMGVQGAMGLFGGESQELQESLLRVQSAMALTQGISGVREAGKSFQALATSVQKFTIVQKVVTGAQWLWNAAMAANPIGAIIAGIVALVAAGVALTKFFMSNAAAAKSNAEAVEKNRVTLENQTKTLDKNANAFGRKQSQELAMAKASGLSAEAIRKLELKLIDEKIAFEKSQRAIAENTYQKNLNTLASLKAAGADSDLIKKQSEVANESIKQYNKQNQDVQKALDEKKEIQNRHLVEIKTAEVNSSKEIAQKRKEANEKAAADAKAKREKELQDEKDAFDKQSEIVKSGREKAKENQEGILEDLKSFGVKKLEETQKTLDQQIAAEKAAAEAEIEIDRIKFEQKMAQANETANVLNNLGTLVGKQTAAGKALGIATALINTYVGVSEALKQKSTLPSPYDYVAKAVNVAAILSTGFKAVKAITSVKVPGGGGGGGGATPSMSASGGGGAPAAPSFNVVGNSGINQVAQTLGAQQPVQAYVVASNVTTQQALDRNIVRNASIG